MIPQSSVETLLNAVAATTTSPWIDVGSARGFMLFLSASGITSGNGVFSVEVSADGSNGVTYNRLIDNVTDTNAQDDVRVASKTLNANGNAALFFPKDDYIRFLRVTCTVTTDGAYTAKLALCKEG